MKIKQGDKVVVIAGKDKGKEGKVIQTLKAQDKVIVEGVNIVKKHIKPNGGADGRIAEVEAPLHVSNVMIVDPKTKKGTKVGYTTDKKGKKIRVSRKSNENQMKNLTKPERRVFMNRLQKKYNEEIVPSLREKYNYKSVMAIPKLEKIVVNMGVGDATSNSKLLDAAVADLKAITGQQPIITKAKKAVANFKVREGQGIGCKVTLRGDNMYNFLDKLISITLPRVRDFRGISPKSFDGRGNYTLGLTEQLIFSEIDYDKVVKVRGMDIVFVTTAHTNEEALDLLKGFGMPFRK